MQSSKKNTLLPWSVFGLLLSLLLLISALYVYNIYKWGDHTDFGLSFRTATGIKVVGSLTSPGRKAGLRVGDHIVRVNGELYHTFSELRELVHRDIGDTNLFLIERNGMMFTIVVTNDRIGFAGSFNKSGYFLVFGLCYMLIGVLVYLMKPNQKTSWVFFLFTAITGLWMTFLFKVTQMSPNWLEGFHLFIYMLLPAAFIHLTLSFPVERRLLKRFPLCQLLPYTISILLFIFISQTTYQITDAAKPLLIITVIYLSVSILFYLGSLLQLWITSKSELAKSRAKLILLGAVISALVPLLDFVSSTFFKVYLLPNFNFYLPFFIFFPMAIAYTIIRHNLFDIDAIIKRTYGYILTTGTLAGLYGVFALIANLIFGEYEITKSPAFPIIFIMAVIILFNPIRNRVQKIIDRMFYRLEYSYKETVERISETMRSLMDMDEIGKSIMRFTLEPMFVDAGSVMILNKNKTSYDCLIQSGEIEHKTENPADFDRHDKAIAEKQPSVECLALSPEEPLMQSMAERKKATTIYDIREDTFFDGNRDECVKTFDQLGATLIVPLIYEDQLNGIIAVGRKKSGKFYRQDDINLLNTLANQGAVAIENARMLEEIVEKERAKAKLMDVFGKYVTDEIRDQILQGQIPLDGETKEVTVLFADLRGFTPLAESTPPKDVVRIINSYFSGMAKAIRENQGIVLQFIGDEIEAAFGAPLPLEDHPTHAVKAALAMQKQLKLVNQLLENEGYEPLKHGIGIHTGRAVAANIGSEDRLSYALVGDTVNLASRIQGLNKVWGTEILISAKTVEQLSDDFNLEKLPTTLVKGKKDSVEIYRFA